MNSLDANFYEVHPKIVQTPESLIPYPLARALVEALLTGPFLQMG